jgi:small-conductance mechanosensitive channel
MATPTPPSSTSPPSAGASWRSVWGQRLSWLISALSGTLEIEAETNRLKQENAKLDAMILQARNDAKQIEREAEQIETETKQIESENARLAVLESKIDGLFSKYNITLPPRKTPEQP